MVISSIAAELEAGLEINGDVEADDSEYSSVLVIVEMVVEIASIVDGSEWVELIVLVEVLDVLAELLLVSSVLELVE